MHVPKVDLSTGTISLAILVGTVHQYSPLEALYINFVF